MKITVSNYGTKGDIVWVKGTDENGNEFMGSAHKKFQSRAYNDIINGDWDGQTVDMTIKENGNYKNIMGIKAASGGSAPAAKPAPQAAAQPKGKWNGGAEFRKPDEITMTEALKMATDIMVGMLDNDRVKKSATNEFIANSVMEIAMDFFQMIKADDPQSAKSDQKDVKKNTDPLPQDDLPDEVPADDA